MDTDNDGIPDIKELGEKITISKLNNIKAWNYKTDPRDPNNFFTTLNSQ